MAIHKFIEYSDNYSKISESLYLFCRDWPTNSIANSESFNQHSEIIVIMLVLSIWRTLEMSLSNLSANCVTTKGNRVTVLGITDTKLCSSGNFTNSR